MSILLTNYIYSNRQRKPKNPRYFGEAENELETSLKQVAKNVKRPNSNSNPKKSAAKKQADIGVDVRHKTQQRP